LRAPGLWSWPASSLFRGLWGVTESPESRAVFFILSQLSATGCSPETEGVEEVGRFLLAIWRNLDLPPYPGGGALPGPKDRPES
jgi:hypothetical protein